MKIPLVIKKIFNWFKLFLAIDVFFVAIWTFILDFNDETLEDEKRIVSAVVSALFLFIAFLLFRWFLKTKRKFAAKDSKKDEFALETAFYLKNQTFIRYMDGWNINGFGTQYFTHHSKQADGSLFAIKWITVAFIPIIPLYQERIKLNSENKKMIFPFFISKSTFNYQLIDRVEITKTLVSWTRIFYYLFFIPMITFPVLFLPLYLKDLRIIFSGTNFWWLILGYVCWGIFIVFLADLWNTRFFIYRNFQKTMK